MSVKTQFEVTQPNWPFEGLLNEKQRKKKLECLKSKILQQMENFRTEAESNTKNSDVALIDKIDCCKKNIFRANELITAYNQLCPQRKHVKTLPTIDFKLWKTKTQEVFYEDIILKIAGYLGYQSLYNWSRVTKALHQTLNNKRPLFDFRLKIASLENYIVRYDPKIWYVSDFANRAEKVYKLFHTIIETLRHLRDEGILNKKEISGLSANLSLAAKRVSHVKKFLEGRFLLIAIQLRLHGILNETISEEKVQKMIDIAIQLRITLTPENINSLFYAPPENGILLFNVISIQIRMQSITENILKNYY